MRAALYVTCLALLAIESFASSRIAYDYAGRRGDVVVIYEALSIRTLAERRQIFATLSSDIKRHVWALQLERHVEKHPELSAAQRAVIGDALASLAYIDLFEGTDLVPDIRTHPNVPSAEGPPLRLAWRKQEEIIVENTDLRRSILQIVQNS